MTHFRISVSLTSFFNDQKSLCYILIDNRFQTIEDLEEHIKQIFKLNADTEICLLSNNHLLPSTEGINILSENDSVQVTPVAKNFFAKSKHKTSNTDDAEFHAKRRKLSRRREDHVDLSSDERDYYKFEQDHGRNKKKRKNKAVQCDEIPTENQIDDIQNVQKIETEDIPAHTQENTIHTDHNGADNKSIQILNVETISSIKMDEVDHKNVEMTSRVDLNGVNESVNSTACGNETTNNSCEYPQNQSPSKTESRHRKKLSYYTVGDFLSFAQQLHERSDVTKSSQVDKNDSNDVEDPDKDLETKPVDVPTPGNVFITKRRRRVRKRKSRADDAVNSFTSQSEDADFEHTKQLKIAAKPILHIRFTDKSPEIITHNNTMTENSKSIVKADQSKPKIESKLVSMVKKSSIESCSNVSDEENLEDESTVTNSSVSLRNRFTELLKKIDLSKNFDEFKSTPLIKDMVPKEDDIIAFKLYEMNEMYEPQISKWVVGKVLKWYTSTKSIDLMVLAGRVQTSIPQGKFDLEDEEDDTSANNVKQQTNIVHLDIMSLIDPKILLIDN